MVELTFLEVHLDGAEFTANAPGSGARSDEKSGGLSFGADDDESGLGEGGASPFPALIAVVGLVVAVVVVRRILGGSGEPVLEG